MAVALVALANQERILVMGPLHEATVSPGAAQVMLSNLERLPKLLAVTGNSAMTKQVALCLIFLLPSSSRYSFIAG